MSNWSKFVFFSSLVAAVAGASAATHAKGSSPSQVTYTGATASFRGNCAPVTSCTGTASDRILGDGSVYTGNPTLTTSFGAFLVTYSGSNYDDFYLRLDATQAPGPYVFLDFRDQVGAATCGSSCRRSEAYDFGTVTVTTTLFQGLLVRPLVDATTGLAISGGFEGMSLGQTAQAGMLLNFPDPFNRKLVWTVRFNPTDYPGSSPVYVTRAGTNTWTIEAGPTNGAPAWAELVASPSGSVQRQTDEGIFNMPFQITVTVP